MLGELLDRIAPVHEDAFLAVDIGDRGAAAPGCDEAGIVGESTLFPVQCGDVDAVRPERALTYRQLRFLASGQTNSIWNMKIRWKQG